ncbi:hypothetical protein GOBAR_DD36268 [Gossypium barbadense]|nr:hypothetical protein GOBAR_DD36268 [Gossypium barbadense]
MLDDKEKSKSYIEFGGEMRLYFDDNDGMKSFLGRAIGSPLLEVKCYRRKDVKVKNNKGDVLQCSHYIPLVSLEGKPLRCEKFCNGNSGFRANASETSMILLPSNMTVFRITVI